MKRHPDRRLTQTPYKWLGWPASNSRVTRISPIGKEWLGKQRAIRWSVPHPSKSASSAVRLTPVGGSAEKSNLLGVCIISDKSSSVPPTPGVFFRTETGQESVREWLKDLPKEERKIIGEDIMTVQFRWPLGMPLVDHLGSGLWEIRSRLPHPARARPLFCSRSGAGSPSWLHQENQKNPTG